MTTFVTIVALVLGLRSLSLFHGSALSGTFNHDSLTVDFLIMHLIDGFTSIFIIVEFLESDIVLLIELVGR